MSREVTTVVYLPGNQLGRRLYHSRMRQMFEFFTSRLTDGDDFTPVKEAQDMSNCP
jgi:hypothetical protein